MSTDRIKQKLTSANSKNDVNKDGYVKVNLVGSKRLLPTNDIDKIVNASEQFKIERQRCKYYRIIGTINPTVSNCLFNLSDTSKNNAFTYSVFNQTIFLDKSYPPNNSPNDLEDITYSESIDANLKEKDGWFGYYNPNLNQRALCKFLDMEPKRERFSFIPDIEPYNASLGALPVKNWELTITYPKYTDTVHKMVNGGLWIIDIENVTVSTRPMTAFVTTCKHNLLAGDLVRITNTNGFDGDYVVYRVGLDNGDDKDYYFVIDIPNTGTLGTNARVKRLVNGVESEYYFRIFTKIKTKSTAIIEQDDYEVYRAGFSENFYNDPLYQFVFNEDIDVTDLTDNLGRPLSELYLTVIKTDSNQMFTQIKSGIETPFLSKLATSDNYPELKKVPLINRIHNGGNVSPSVPFTTHIPLENGINISSTNFYGDLVEYNKTTLKEYVLVDIMHRFNTINRETTNTLNTISGPPTALGVNAPTTLITLGPRYEGYYYKAHHQIKIREFSNYIEEGDVNLLDLPPYSIISTTGSYIWRDLLDIGFNESNEKPLDYPFLNGTHHMYQNYCFTVKRQDPYGVWGLITTTFPSDAIGDKITNKFKVNAADDVC